LSFLFTFSKSFVRASKGSFMKCFKTFSSASPGDAEEEERGDLFLIGSALVGLLTGWSQGCSNTPNLLKTKLVK
jgi:hypothetical protein